MRATEFGGFLGVLLLAGCGGDDGGMPPVSVDPGDGGSTNRCIDEDGDGAGQRCGRIDCDDNDPDVTNECTLCTTPALDCPCEEGTEPLPCDPKELGQQVEMNGRLLQCTEGARYCHEVAGVEDTWVWTDCNAIFTPL
jgi:hypothetical protein